MLGAPRNTASARTISRSPQRWDCPSCDPADTGTIFRYRQNMQGPPPDTRPLPPALADNIAHFARVLRTAGLAIGPGAVLDALHALTQLDLGQRDDVQACLRALFVRRYEDIETFDQAFRLFFRSHAEIDAALSLLLPQSQLTDAQVQQNVSRRVAEAVPPPPARLRPRKPPPPPDTPIELDASDTFSTQEVLRRRDFAEMSAAELASARRLIAGLRFAIEPMATRRHQPAVRGPRIDLRRTLHASLRSGGDSISLCFRRRRTRTPPLVVLCDISGSMNRYTEMLLRFIHTLMLARKRVQAFLLGTRLSNATRLLRSRDIDLALRRCGAHISDWGGGTRLGLCLREFNHRWSRRVLGQGAIVLLITDGLDREPEVDLAAEGARLARSCRRLVWLNPLLSYDGFQPRAQGIRALLPHVDEFRPVHNLDSLQQLATALSAPAQRLRGRPPALPVPP